MGIRLDELVTQKYPPGSLYMPAVESRLERGSELPYSAPPYTSILDDVMTNVEDVIAHAHFASLRSFPTRLHAGQRSAERLFGTRGSPLVPAERPIGSFIAVSV